MNRRSKRITAAAVVEMSVAIRSGTRPFSSEDNFTVIDSRPQNVLIYCDKRQFWNYSKTVLRLYGR